jgi:hypothetical protein
MRFTMGACAATLLTVTGGLLNLDRALQQPG